MNSTQRFEHKVVIVTGAAQGIGRGVALRIAQEGGCLILADRSDLIQAVLAEIKALGALAIAVETDLETYAGAELVVSHAIAEYGRIDVLINNVGGAIWIDRKSVV